VAYFSSGDEIKSIGQPLGEGDIYDSNRYTLFGMLSDLGVDIIDMGVIPDNEAAINQALLSAAEEADMVLTSGGVSVGEADYIAAAMDTLAKPYFRKVAIKPGRPVTFARIGEAYFFGLPGNPVAVMTTFLQFARPAIKRLQGANDCFLPLVTARANCNLRKLPGRTEYQRGILEQGEDGEMVVDTTGKQGSGVLSSMSNGNCFIVLDETTSDVEEGDWVTVQPFTLLRY
ncbi:MAG: molybdopterin molybdenumtransferase MoeA, partial [Aestuariibacter sp.]|nr:molybdopterin molybdenumtransferase MoeA [Aestuariibacter sp.]